MYVFCCWLAGEEVFYTFEIRMLSNAFCPVLFSKLVTTIFIKLFVEPVELNELHLQ